MKRKYIKWKLRVWFNEVVSFYSSLIPCSGVQDLNIFQIWFRSHSLQQSLSALYKLDFLFFLFLFLRFHWQAKRIPARLLWQKCNLRILAFGSSVECVHFWELEMFKLDFSPLKYANVVRIFIMKVPLSFLHKWKLVGPSTRWGSRRTSEISQGSSANCDVTQGWFSTSLSFSLERAEEVKDWVSLWSSVQARNEYYCH